MMTVDPAADRDELDRFAEVAHEFTGAPDPLLNDEEDTP